MMKKSRRLRARTGITPPSFVELHLLEWEIEDLSLPLILDATFYKKHNIINSDAQGNNPAYLYNIIPGIGCPAAIRAYAYFVIVVTSFVSSTRRASAAQASTVGSSAPVRPTSCTRTRSASGLRRQTPRTIALLKFSSANKRSTYCCSLAWRRAKSRSRIPATRKRASFSRRTCCACCCRRWRYTSTSVR